MSSKKNRTSPSGGRSSQKFDVVLFDGGTVSTVTCKILTITCTGVKSTDVLIGANSIQKTGLSCVPSRVVSDDVVEIVITNPTAASITTGTVSYTFCVEHFSI